MNEQTLLAHNSKVEVPKVIGALSDVRVDFRLSQIIAKVKFALEESRGSDPQRYEQSDDQEGDDIWMNTTLAR